MCVCMFQTVKQESQEPSGVATLLLVLENIWECLLERCMVVVEDPIRTK